MSLPMLYSFRRCPFAIRARMALDFAGIQVQIIEVSLKNKPQALFDISPKASVPVLHLPCGQVIDESLDIMRWAFLNSKQSFEHLVFLCDSSEAKELISHNDTEFKYWLDRYKYSDRQPEHKLELCQDTLYQDKLYQDKLYQDKLYQDKLYQDKLYQDKVYITLSMLEARLQQHTFLMPDTGLNRPSRVDIAIFPFIRQCAAVDVQWFTRLGLLALERWHQYWLTHPVFLKIMLKRAPIANEC